MHYIYIDIYLYAVLKLRTKSKEKNNSKFLTKRSREKNRLVCTCFEGPQIPYKISPKSIEMLLYRDIEMSIYIYACIIIIQCIIIIIKMHHKKLCKLFFIKK